MQIAVVNSSKSLASADAAFMVAACAAQLAEFAKAWNIDPVAAALYANVDSLPVDDTWPCEILDSLDEKGALGYHSAIGNRPVLRILAQGADTSITLSHEFLETLGDPTCDRWVARGDGSEIAVEVCDPVEGDHYEQSATIGGETRAVRVSNYVLPPYFDRSLAGPTDRMATGVVPFGLRPGGYYVVLDASGNENEVFARVQHGGAGGIWAAGLKLAKQNGRLLRRLRGRR